MINKLLVAIYMVYLGYKIATSTKVDESDVLTLSERLRTEVGNTNAVRLIERKALENILQEVTLLSRIYSCLNPVTINDPS